MKKLIFLLISCVSWFSYAGNLYPYHRLATRDLDQMNKIIKEKIRESKKTAGNKVVPLKEALQAVFSRPNDDFMIEKLIAPLKAELDEHSAWEKSIEELVTEATGALNNPKSFRADALATYHVFLENLISESKPRALELFEKKILTRIQDANITLAPQVFREFKLKMMKAPTSPSKLAEIVLTEAQKEPQQEVEKKSEKK